MKTQIRRTVVSFGWVAAFLMAAGAAFKPR